MKKKDILLIVVILVIALISFLVKGMFIKDAEEVAISINGENYGVYDLHKDKEIDIHNHNIVEIKDNSVHMKYADCPDKLCIKQGTISKDGEKIVCLPNKTVVEIKSSNKNDYDIKSK